MKLLLTGTAGRCAAAVLAALAMAAGAATLEDNVKAMQATNAEAGAAQKNIVNLQAETQAMVEEYKRWPCRRRIWRVCVSSWPADRLRNNALCR